jgi:plasmid stabilization system protein ParE
MAWRIEFSQNAEGDLIAIFQHLRRSYGMFGEAAQQAANKARNRIRDIRRTADRITLTPYIGTMHRDAIDGARHVTFDRTTYWFELDPSHQVVRVIGIFLERQDHFRVMADRVARKD